MSTTLRRVFSGSVAAWTRVGVGLFSQLALVPIYLASWDLATYGAWLSLHAVLPFIQIIDNGHSRFLGNEFLRLGPDRKKEIRETFWSGAIVACGSGGLQLFLVVIALASAPQWVAHHLQLSDNLLQQVKVVLIAQAVMWWVFGSVGGIAVTALSPFGHYPIMAWWGVIISLVVSLTPATIAYLGGSLQAAGLAMVLATVTINLPLCLHIAILFRRCSLSPQMPNFRLGLINLFRSLSITARSFVDQFRQQGLRLVVASQSGLGDVTRFATIRTGSNVLQQGLGTVTHPLLPEIMRFVTRREQAKLETAMSSVWLIVLAILAPGALFATWLAPSVFRHWTGGRIEFDPWLFGLLVSSVLVYAVAQPAASIVDANNRLTALLTIATGAAAVTLSIAFSRPTGTGIWVIGVSVLVGEIVAATGHVLVCAKWLSTHQMRWPTRSFAIAASGVAITVMGIAAMNFWPSATVLLMFAALACIVGLLTILITHVSPQVLNTVRSKLENLRLTKLLLGKDSL